MEVNLITVPERVVYIVNVVFGKDIGVGVGEMTDAHDGVLCFLGSPVLRLDMVLLHGLEQVSTAKSIMG